MGPRPLGPRLDQGFQSVRTDDMLFLPSAWTYEAGLPSETRILGFWDNVIPVISGIGVDTVCSFSPQCGPEGPVSVPGCGASSFYYTDWLERPGYGSRSRARPQAETSGTQGRVYTITHRLS